MSSLMIFLIVIIHVVLPSVVVNGASVQNIDLRKLLDFIDQQRSTDSIDSTSSDISDVSLSSSDVVFRNQDTEESKVAGILTQLLNNRNNKVDYYEINDRKENPLLQESQIYFNSDKKYNNNQRIAQVLGQVLNADRTDVEPKLRYKFRSVAKRQPLQPNRLLGNSIYNEDSGDSTVYVLLNPRMMKKSKYTKDAVYNLISKVLASPPLKRAYQEKPKQMRVKGIKGMGFAERRRGSREAYDDEEEKPKRGRNNAGGGDRGGSGGGHTAIPYLRHRGENIYEKY